VWAKKGVSIPRTTYQQIKAGKQVPINNLQPGDAVFFGSARDPHHVGMYIGHGQYVQAPHTGDVVKISNLSERNDFVQARRFA
jgi:cell wall-associated NlpC family hydrolase